MTFDYPPSLLGRLSAELEVFAARIQKLVASVPVKYLDSHPGGGVIFAGFPSYNFDPLDDLSKAKQALLLRDWREWRDAYIF